MLPSLHALRAVAWCMRNSVPDDTPPASPALMPQPLWGSTKRAMHKVNAKSKGSSGRFHGSAERRKKGRGEPSRMTLLWLEAKAEQKTTVSRRARRAAGSPRSARSCAGGGRGEWGRAGGSSKGLRLRLRYTGPAPNGADRMFKLGRSPRSCCLFFFGHFLFLLSLARPPKRRF